MFTKVSFIDLKEMSVLYCGGVLISPSFVLTAAHCVDDLEKRDLDICKTQTLPKECYRSPDSFKIGILVRPNKDIVKRKKVKRVIPHPEYSPESNVNDIALVELKRKVDCHKLVKPICLPHKDLSQMDQTLIISGWGRYDRIKGSKQMLMEGTVSQIQENECVFPLPKERHIICARGVDSGQASCQGDSGTAIFKEDDGTGQFFALGITSVGPDNCTSTNPDSYSDIFHYMKWIKSYVKDLPLPKSEEKRREGNGENSRKKKD
ncbi:Vitamin K-dependent protein C [Araneus ventricosus]|uniref:Vitamin K-dependent protein C n=1 Tax=Araneus ventricosus TaxID=182803 RepID=A0A4Y2NYM4_ARAVE|nr:Vitamin K-dependent protein C [Araneus ventricosus]